MCIRPTHCVRKSRSCDPYPFVPVLLERVLYKMVLLVIVAIFPQRSSCFCCLFCLHSQLCPGFVNFLSGLTLNISSLFNILKRSSEMFSDPFLFSFCSFTFLCCPVVRVSVCPTSPSLVFFCLFFVQFGSSYLFLLSCVLFVFSIRAVSYFSS